MYEGADQDSKLSEQGSNGDQPDTLTSKEDFEKYRVKPFASNNEAEISVKPTSSIKETDSTVKPTTSINETDFTFRLTAAMNEAAISVQPTSPINGVCVSVKLTAPMSEADISVQPTNPINEVCVSVKLTAPINETDTSVHPTAPNNEVSVSVKLTAPINETDNSATEISEDHQEARRVFKWIERKLNILKFLQNSDDDRISPNEHCNVSLDNKSTVLEEMLEDIQKMTSIPKKTDDLSKEVTRMLDMLQETTLGMLDSLNLSRKRCLSIKVLATLIQHLSASFGTKVTFQDVQKCINGKLVMELYGDVQNAREPRCVKLGTAKRYLEHGIKKAQVLKRKSKSHKSRVDWTISECTRTIDVRNANETLKALTKESESLLLKYADSISYLMTKAKSFVSLKNDIERVLSYFMTKEIQDLYKA